MNEMIVIGLGIIILIIVAKCVILLRYLQKISKKSYTKYQKSKAKTQLKKFDSESNIIREPEFLTFNTEIFY